MPSLRVPNMFRPAFVSVLLAVTALTGCTPTWVESQYRQPEGFATWADGGPTAYVIQPGDDISVVFPFTVELNHQAPVSPDGTFSIFVAGALPAAGLSTTQLANDIDRALAAKGVTANAHALVSVMKYAGMVYVAGEVGVPGEVQLRPGMDVLQAITSARGLRTTARTNEVVLIRRGPEGRPMMRTIDLTALTRRGDPTQAVALQAWDTIYVPQSSISEVNQWVDQYINLALPFNKNINYSYNQDSGSGSNRNNNNNNN